MVSRSSKNGLMLKVRTDENSFIQAFLFILPFSLIFFVLFSGLFFSSTSYAKNLGKVGQVYPIKEMDILVFIQSRLNEMKKSGKLEEINRKMIEIIKKRADRPVPVKSISPTKKYRRWFIDPSVTFDKDIIDVKGDVIIKAGTVINPLEKISLKTAKRAKTVLMFFDGDDKSQVAWIKRRSNLANKENKGNEKNNKGKKSKKSKKSKLILVNGSVSEQVKNFKGFKKKIYFDQHGRLTNKFKIKHTPAMVTQEKMQFKVEELVP